MQWDSIRVVILQQERDQGLGVRREATAIYVRADPCSERRLIPRTKNRGYTHDGGCCKARGCMSYLSRSPLADDSDGGSRIDATRPYPALPCAPPPPLPPPLPPDPADRRWAPATRGSLSLTISPLIIRTLEREQHSSLPQRYFCLCCGECCRENSERRGSRRG